MANFEEHLFGRIAVLSGYLTPTQLEECLRKQRECQVSSPIKIGKLLLEEGYLNEEQLARIVEIRRKKMRRLSRSAEEILHAERRFRKRALESKAVTPGQLETAVLEQQRLHSLNIQVPIWEVLVSAGVLEVTAALELLNREDLTILACDSCDLYFNVEGGIPLEECRCERCGEVLHQPVFLDTVSVDVVLQRVRGDDLTSLDFEGTGVLEVN